MTINTREELVQLDLRCYLQAFFVIVFDFDSKRTGLQKQNIRSFLPRIQLRMVQRCVEKAVTTASLEGQPCQI